MEILPADIFTDDLYQAFKEEIILIFKTVSENRKRETMTQFIL